LPRRTPQGEGRQHGPGADVVNHTAPVVRRGTMLRPVSASCLLVALVAAAAAAEGLKEDLWAAAKKGDAAQVKALLARGADVNTQTAYHRTALSLAAEKGHLEVVKLLLSHKADVNVKDTFYQTTALSWAVSGSHAAVVKALLEAGADGADTAL